MEQLARLLARKLAAGPASRRQFLGRLGATVAGLTLLLSGSDEAAAGSKKKAGKKKSGKKKSGKKKGTKKKGSKKKAGKKKGSKKKKGTKKKAT